MVPLIEVCSNEEWLENNAGLDLDIIPEGDWEDAANFLGNQIHLELEIMGFETISARGQRILYHGWNGANIFRHKMGPVGTFDRLSEKQISKIYKALELALDKTHKIFKNENLSFAMDHAK